MKSRQEHRIQHSSAVVVGCPSCIPLSGRFSGGTFTPVGAYCRGGGMPFAEAWGYLTDEERIRTGFVRGVTKVKPTSIHRQLREEMSRAETRRRGE